MAFAKKHARSRLALIEQFGGKCVRCGYSKCTRALHFHHVDPSEKKQWSKERGDATVAEITAHPERFLLLCANCHIEEHVELVEANQKTATCTACKKEFRVQPHKLRTGKRLFCSQFCKNRQRTTDATINFEPRFWKHVNKSGDCWIWTAYKLKGGIGLMMVVHPDGHKACKSVNRISWELAYGPIPDGSDVKHTCKNASCVRPDHLYLTSSAVADVKATEFLFDMEEEPRCVRGNKPSLSPERMDEIRRRYAVGDVTQTQLAEEFGVSGTIVSNVIRHAIGISKT